MFSLQMSMNAITNNISAVANVQTLSEIGHVTAKKDSKKSLPKTTRKSYVKVFISTS